MPTVPPVTRLSLKNILFPTDFSPASQAALPFAEALAQIYGSTIFVTHALPPGSHARVATDHLPVEVDYAWQDAQHKLDEFTHGLSLGENSVKPLLGRGDLTDMIPTLIREHEVDLIVLGTHGRRGVSKLVLGSSAEKIYRSATCPVLTVGPHVRATADWSPRRILCPVDLAEDPEPLLHYALALAEENQAEFILLQAIPLVPWQHRAAVEERSRRALESLLPEHAEDWCTPETEVRWEHPAEAILHAAYERAADLIVMTVHKSRASTFSAHLPWPVASEVVSRAACPVLTIRI